MDRRDFMQFGAAALAAGAASPALAQGRRPAAPAAAAPTPAPAPPSGPPAKLKIDAYSRHLQWLRTPEEVADAVIEMGFDGLDITVRPAPGHVDPEKVATELPAFVNAIRARGLLVDTITTNIADADSPNAERILDAASQLGIHHYWWGSFRYERDKPLMPQLDALKPRVAKLAALNAKYGMKAMYHTYSGNVIVGSAVWDMLYILREFDPRYVSLHYDTGHQANAGGNNTWVLGMKAAGPYIGGLSVKDTILELAFEPQEGGPFTGTPAELNARPPGGFGGPGGPPAAGGPGVPGPAVPPAARNDAAVQAAAERGAPQAAPGGAPRPGAGGPGGRSGGPGGGNGPGGRGPQGRGGGGQSNPWRVRQVPLGTGLVDLPVLAQTLKGINFSGPVEIQAEYPNGGAENAGTRLTLPRAIVLGNMKRDLLTLKAAFGPAGLI